MKPILFGFIGAASVIVVALLAVAGFQVLVLLRRQKKQKGAKEQPVLPIMKANGGIASTAALSSFSSFSSPSSGLREDRGRVFLFREVEDASEGFSNHIGDGATYLVFKGILADGTEVAIKRMRENLVGVSSEVAKFHLQVDLLYRVRHQHLVNLVGFCDQRPHRMLLCQYAPNGSLFDTLHGDAKDEELLSWKQRLRIAMGVAYGLSYLHLSCNPPVIHGDLSSVNVLLTEDFAAKITGLGKVPFVRAASQLQTGRRSTSGADDVRSFLPEQQSRALPLRSRADDVYSFGVVLLELLTGRTAETEEDGGLADWAAPYLASRETMPGLMDAALKNVHAAEFCAVCEIARLCVQKEGARRPPINDVLQALLLTSNISVEVAAPISSPVTLRGLMAAAG